MNLFENPYFQKLLDKLTRQAEDGVPIEAQGFVDHPMDDSEMPVIEHTTRHKRPDWVEDILKDWNQVQ